MLQFTVCVCGVRDIYWVAFLGTLITPAMTLDWYLRVKPWDALKAVKPQTPKS